MINHLWYLNPRTAALAFFDNKLSVDVKRRMVERLKVCESSQQGNRKRIQTSMADIRPLLDKGIEDFITSESLEFF